MGITSWATGRDEKESDVYANYDEISEVTSRISKIVSDMNSSISIIEDAVNELNKCKGIGEYIQPVNVAGVTETLNFYREQIANIGNDITTKAESIKVYEEASWLEKGASTFTMVGAKILEGSLKVFEDMGDGIVSVVGWIAPKDSGLENACKTFVEKDLSHDAFSAYYDSEFAKKSIITEDSGIAGVSKFAGQLGTFILLGNGVSKLAGNLTQSESALLRSAGTFAQSEKRLDVLQAGLEGMGVGTAEKLKKGLSMDESVIGGMKRATIQGGSAWAVGTLIQKGIKMFKARKAMKGTANITDDALDLTVRNTGDIGEGAAIQFKRSMIGTANDNIEILTEGAVDGASKNISGVVSHVDDVITKQGDDVLRLASKGDNATSFAIRNMDNAGESAVTKFKRSVTSTIDDDVKILTEESVEGVTGRVPATIPGVSSQTDEVASQVFKSVDNRIIPSNSDNVVRVFAGNSDEVIDVTSGIAKKVVSTSDSSSGVRKFADEYLENLDEMRSRNISFEKYCELKGSPIKYTESKAAAGELFQDAKGEMHAIINRVGSQSGIKQKYLNEADKAIDNYVFSVSDNIMGVKSKVKAAFKKGGLSDEASEELWDVYKYKAMKNSDTTAQEMFNSVSKYMTPEETERITKIINNNDSYATKLINGATQAQKDAVYVYTKNGFEEFNSILTGDVKNYYMKYYEKNGISQEGMLKNVYEEALGGKFGSDPTQAVNELQQLVSDNKIQQDIIVHRVTQSFGTIDKAKKLQVGGTFTNPGFTSATASLEDVNNIIAQKGYPKFRLDIFVPAGSNAAYIEPLSGVGSYFQNEVLINPNSTLTITDIVRNVKYGNSEIIVLKCILS